MLVAAEVLLVSLVFVRPVDVKGDQLFSLHEPPVS